MVQEPPKQKKVIKTFGRVNKPNNSLDAALEKHCETVTVDKDLALQQKIDEIILDEHLRERKRQKESKVSKFDEGLSSGSDPEFDVQGLGLRRVRAGRSLHEIMEAGQNNRFFDEVEYLVEGISSGRPKSRLACMDELVEKILGAPEFGRRMRAHGMLGRAFEGLLELLNVGGQDVQEKARSGIVFLLLCICHDTNKLEAYIPLGNLVQVATVMLKECKPFTYGHLLHKLPDFKAQTIPSSLVIKESVFGLWVLERILGSAKGLSFEPETIELALGFISTCPLSCQLEHMAVGWALVVTSGTLPDERVVEEAFSLISRIIPHSAADNWTNELILSAMKLVLFPFSHVSPVSFYPKYFSLIGRFLPETNIEMAMLSLACLTNILETSEMARESIRFDQSKVFDLLLNSFSLSSLDDRLKQQISLVLGILSRTNPTNKQLILKQISLPALKACLSSIQMIPAEDIAALLKDLDE